MRKRIIVWTIAYASIVSAIIGSWFFEKYRAGTFFGAGITHVPPERLFSWFLDIVVPSIAPFLIIFVASGVVFLAIFYKRKTRTCAIRYSYATGIIASFVVLYGNVLLLSYVRIVPSIGESALPYTNIVRHSAMLLMHSAILSGAIFLLVGIAALWGFALLRWMRAWSWCVRQDQMLRGLLVVGVGLHGIIGALFFLAICGFFSRWAVWSMIALTGSIGWRTILSGARSCMMSRTKTITITGQLWWWGTMSVVLFGIAFADVLRNIPYGFDALSYYDVRVVAMVARGGLVAGGYPFPFELLTAGWYALSGTFFTGYAVTLVASGLCAYMLYGMARRLIGASREASLGAVALWLTMPMTFDIGITQTKPDLFAVYCGGVGIWLVWLWMRTDDRVACAWGIGCFAAATMIKLTAALVFMAFGIGVLLAHWRRIVQLLRDLRWRRWCVIAITIPIALWCVLAFVTRDARTEKSWTAVMTSGDPYGARITHDDWRAMGIDPQTCNYTGLAEDLSRFRDPAVSFFEAMVRSVWDVSMGSVGAMNIFSVDVGWIFLALLPLWGMPAVRRRACSLPIPWRMSVYGVMLYWVLWTLFAHNLAWYALPLAPVVLMGYVALLHGWSAIPRSIRALYWVAIGLSMTWRLFMLAQTSAQPIQLQRAAGMHTDRYVHDAYMGSLMNVVDILHTDPEGRILASPTQIAYFLQEQDRRIIRDQFFDIFACLYQEGDVRITQERLRFLRVRYVVHLGRRAQEQSVLRKDHLHQSHSFAEKIMRYNTFEREGLQEVYQDANIGLYRVPQ